MKKLLMSVLFLLSVVSVNLDAFEVGFKVDQGERVTVEVSEPVTISKVRQAFAHKLGLQPGDFRILFAGRVLSDQDDIDFKHEYLAGHIQHLITLPSRSVSPARIRAQQKDLIVNNIQNALTSLRTLEATPGFGANDPEMYEARMDSMINALNEMLRDV
jgi:hypothetical protein